MEKKRPSNTMKKYHMKLLSSPNMLISGLPRRCLEQTLVTAERLANDIRRYQKILSKKHEVSGMACYDDVLIDTAQAILNTYKVDHRWLDITDINMNPDGSYIYNGGKAKMEEAMKKALKNPPKRVRFLWFRRKWWNLQWKYQNRKSKSSNELTPT